jgi:uncharacterized Zn finger protein (UPF0148 family)
VKTATYRLLNGEPLVVEYDPEAPCTACGLPVVEASVGGTALCPWCDMGYNRRGDRIWMPRKATPEEYAAAVEALRS